MQYDQVAADSVSCFASKPAQGDLVEHIEKVGSCVFIEVRVTEVITENKIDIGLDEDIELPGHTDYGF